MKTSEKIRKGDRVNTDDYGYGIVVGFSSNKLPIVSFDAWWIPNMILSKVYKVD